MTVRTRISFKPPQSWHIASTALATLLMYLQAYTICFILVSFYILYWIHGRSQQIKNLQKFTFPMYIKLNSPVFCTAALLLGWKKV
jgi:uncharacterized membrane protein